MDEDRKYLDALRARDPVAWEREMRGRGEPLDDKARKPARLAPHLRLLADGLVKAVRERLGAQDERIAELQARVEVLEAEAAERKAGVRRIA